MNYCNIKYWATALIPSHTWLHTRQTPHTWSTTGLLKELFFLSYLRIYPKKKIQFSSRWVEMWSAHCHRLYPWDLGTRDELLKAEPTATSHNNVSDQYDLSVGQYWQRRRLLCGSLQILLLYNSGTAAVRGGKWDLHFLVRNSMEWVWIPGQLSHSFDNLHQSNQSATRSAETMPDIYGQTPSSYRQAYKWRTRTSKVRTIHKSNFHWISSNPCNVQQTFTRIREATSQRKRPVMHKNWYVEGV